MDTHGIKEKETVMYKVGRLTAKQQEDFDDLIKRYGDIFVKDKNKLGRTNVTKHNIDTGNEKPIKQRPYRMSQKEKEVNKEELQKMLKKEVIRKSKSSWSSPVTFVPKKNGEVRYCIDYRKLNQVTKKDNHPLPRIDDILDQMQGSQWFSTIDLASGYWQVEIEEEDKEKTAFITNEGLYEFNVMPFGLCNAPATFQRLMHEVLGDLIYNKAPVYIDDVNVHSKTFEQHLEDLEEVFERIRRSGLKLRMDKCHFCDREIEFLGYIVGKDGIKTSEKIIEKVKNYPRPTNVTEVRGFLGLASYYRRFIKDFSKLAKPITELLRKDTKFEWSEKQEKSFQQMKEKLTTAPVLAYPNFEKEFIIYTNASNIALGAVLSQEGDEGEEHVIQYAARSLSRAEQVYTTTEKECLAVIWAVNKFHHYIHGKKCKVVTDHYSLQWLHTQPIKGGRIGRWIIKLQPYDLEIVHRKGKKHQNVNALSRMKGI